MELAPSVLMFFYAVFFSFPESCFISFVFSGVIFFSRASELGFRNEPM